MYQNLVIKYGFWDQIRVDHGREFYLMLHLQQKFQEFRFDPKKKTLRAINFKTKPYNRKKLARVKPKSRVCNKRNAREF